MHTLADQQITPDEVEQLREAVEAALAAGMARVTDWQGGLTVREVDWPEASAFANINAPRDVQAWSRTR